MEWLVKEMMGAVEIGAVLACPVCGNEINGEMQCTFCNRKYSSREGVYILIDSETSGMEWKWDKRIISQKYRQEVMKGYQRLISPDIRKAHEKWWNITYPKIGNLSGNIVDLATGLGMMLEQVLKRSNNSSVIATDIDPNVLLSTKRDFEKKGMRKAFYLATDIKHMALREGVADNVTSFAGLNNITDTELVVAELYRIMKPGGKALLMASFFEEDTPSAELAEDYGFLDAYIKEKFFDLIGRTGFQLVEDREASSVIWKENEMDIFPIDGDKVYYHTIEIKK
ncbi:hypothetical protein IX51_10315 [uncultured archaeon]|nr:hypothetical protein IX51_10315 [uncultured archaeon]